MWLCKSQGSNAVQKQTKNMAWFQPSKQGCIFFIYFSSCMCECTHVISHGDLWLFHRKWADVALAARSLQASKADINSRGHKIYLLLQAIWEPRQQSTPLTSFMGPEGSAQGKASVRQLPTFSLFAKISPHPVKLIGFEFFPSQVSFLTWMKP